MAGEKEVVIEDVAKTALVLANIAEVTAIVIRKVAGNDLSTALNGETLTKDNLTNLSLASAASVLSK